MHGSSGQTHNTTSGFQGPPARENCTLTHPYLPLYVHYLEYVVDRTTTQGYTTVRKHTLRFLKWLQRRRLLPEHVTGNDCVHYRNYLSTRKKKDGSPLSTGTVINRMKAGKAFFRYLVDRGVCETNPFAAVPYPRLPEHVSRNLLNEAQMGNLLNRLGQFNRKKHQRDRLRDYKVHVVSEVLYASGLRISEAAGLLPEQIDTSQRLIFVAEGKNRKSRIAFLSRYAAEVLSVYMSYGRGRILGGYRRTWGDRVFGTHPERLSSLVNREVGGCCRELGIPVITSHGFRHSLGTHLHRAGCDMRYIQMILGHESLGSTQVYTAVDRSELRKILDLYHGR